MLTSVSKYRVLYADTDKMGYFYHGNYTELFEIGRSEMLRSAGFSYKKLEEKGFILPVVELHVQYKNPAYYDDVLSIHTTLEQMPSVRMEFSFEIWSQHDLLICNAKTVLVFADSQSKKPVKAPSMFLDALVQKGL